METSRARLKYQVYQEKVYGGCTAWDTEMRCNVSNSKPVNARNQGKPSPIHKNKVQWFCAFIMTITNNYFFPLASNNMDNRLKSLETPFFYKQKEERLSHFK